MQLYFRCDVCNKVIYSKARLHQHKKRHVIGLKPYICDYCKKCFTHKTALERHLLTIHVDSDPLFECEICSKRYDFRINDSNDFLILKLYLFPKKKHFFFRFQLAITLRNHKYNVHREKKPKVTCEICGKQFINNAALSKHMHCHEDASEKLARSTQCEHCGEWLVSKSGIYYHEQIHTSGPQTCEQCGAELPHKIALLAHIRKVHREARFKCSYCELAFTERTKLTVNHTYQTLKDFASFYFVEILIIIFHFYYCLLAIISAMKNNTQDTKHIHVNGVIKYLHWVHQGEHIKSDRIQ